MIEHRKFIALGVFVSRSQVTDWLQENVKGAVSKMDIKICSKWSPDCKATQMRYETHNSPRFACARIRLSDHIRLTPPKSLKLQPCPLSDKRPPADAGGS
jgi:hypothetical protein